MRLLIAIRSRPRSSSRRRGSPWRRPRPHQALIDSTVRYLQERQSASGGFAEPGQGAEPGFSAWVALALASAGINPQDQARCGTSAFGYLEAHFRRGPGRRTRLARRSRSPPSSGNCWWSTPPEPIPTASPAMTWPGRSSPGSCQTAPSPTCRRRAAANRTTRSSRSWRSARSTKRRSKRRSTPRPANGSSRPRTKTAAGTSRATPRPRSSEVDMTGAALEALVAAGPPAEEPALARYDRRSPRASTTWEAPSSPTAASRRDPPTRARRRIERRLDRLGGAGHLGDRRQPGNLDGRAGRSRTARLHGIDAAARRPHPLAGEQRHERDLDDLLRDPGVRRPGAADPGRGTRRPHPAAEAAAAGSRRRRRTTRQQTRPRAAKASSRAAAATAPRPSADRRPESKGKTPGGAARSSAARAASPATAAPTAAAPTSARRGDRDGRTADRRRSRPGSRGSRRPAGRDRATARLRRRRPGGGDGRGERGAPLPWRSAHGRPRRRPAKKSAAS